MKIKRKTIIGSLFIVCLTVAMLLCSLTTIIANAESVQPDDNISNKVQSILMHDDIYPGMDKIQNVEGWLYTYTIDEQTFSSEISEDDVWRKAMFWQYEQGLKTIEEIEFEYAKYTSRGITYIPPSYKKE